MSGLVSTPLRLLTLLSFVLVVAGLCVSPGFFNIDEVVYVLGLDGFLRTGGYAVENGYGRFGSNDLTVWFLHPGTDGLASQYPVGTAWLGAAFFPVFGFRSLIAINVLSGVGTLIVTYLLAVKLFASQKVGLLATAFLAIFSFWSEYVFGHWPHAVSVFCTALATLFLFDALPRAQGAFRPAVVSGLALGAGMLFRLDGILLAPGLAIVTILWAARPVSVLAGGAVGMAPMVGLLAATNHAKFATWNPLSYGASGGGTDLASHTGTVAVLLVALAGLVLLRVLPVDGRRLRLGLGLAVVVGGGLVLFSPLAPTVWKLLHGTWAILFDVTAINDPRPGVVRRPDGTLSFWGLPKKALFQSLPWLGLIGYVLVAAPAAVRRGATMVLIISAVWALPFLALSWHGGLGSNMRYLLPLLPGLSALAAWALYDLAGRREDGGGLVRYGILAAVVLTFLVRRMAPEAVWPMQQVYATWIFFAVLALALAVGLVRSQPHAGRVTAVTLLVAGAAMGVALSFGSSDLETSQRVRIANEHRSQSLESIAGPVIFYGAPEHYANAIGQADRLLAIPYPPGSTGTLDPRLLEAACAQGYRVVIRVGTAVEAGLSAERLTALDIAGMTGHDQHYEIGCD